MPGRVQPRIQCLLIRRSRLKRELGDELANRIFGQGTTIKTEELSYKSFQKNYGRSVKVRAPGMLISMLQRKAASAGGGVIEIKPGIHG